MQFTVCITVKVQMEFIFLKYLYLPNKYPNNWATITNTYK